jgi:hypothetical protein
MEKSARVPKVRRPLGGKAPQEVEAGKRVGDDTGVAFRPSNYNYGGKIVVGCIGLARPIGLTIVKPGHGKPVLERITPKCYNLLRCTGCRLPGKGRWLWSYHRQSFSKTVSVIIGTILFNTPR